MKTIWEEIVWSCDFWWNDMMMDWPWGSIVGVLLAAIVLFIVGLALYGLFIAVDSWFQPRKRGRGKIVGHDFTPAHTVNVPVSTTVNGVTTTTYIPTRIPDTWSVCVQLGRKSDWVEVNKGFHDRTNNGDEVGIKYVQGRLTRNLYVKEIYG